MPTNHKKRDRSDDDIQTILQHSGMASARLDRFEEVSSQMWQLEWEMMKRAAARAAVCKPKPEFPSGD